MSRLTYAVLLLVLALVLIIGVVLLQYYALENYARHMETEGATCFRGWTSHGYSVVCTSFDISP